MRSQPIRRRYDHKENVNDNPKHISLVFECIPDMQCVSSFVLHTASSLTKDCLQLLKLLGVPVIQVQPTHKIHTLYLFIFPTCSLISPLFFSLCLWLVLQAPADAEALCAWLVRVGTVDAVASEDMDTLPFGASTLIRQLNAKRHR